MTFVRRSRLGFLPTHVTSSWFSKIPGAPSRRGRNFLRCLAAVLLALLAPVSSWASFSLTFQGLVRTADTSGGTALSSPAGIVVDTAGNVFISDTGNGRIVEVNAFGVASVLSISGLSPSLSSPSALAIDGSGNLYVADTGNSRVVKVSASGAGSVVATGGVTLSSPRGLALDQAGDVFIADTGNNRIVEVTAGGSAAALTITVSSGASTLSSPSGLAVNVGGKLYIADSGNNRIVTVASGSTTGVVQSILGGVTLSNPEAVAVDRIGNVVIADTGNDRIAEIDTLSNGTVLFTDSQTLNGPLAMALDVLGTVYIADTGGNRALIVDPPVNGDLTSADPTYSLNQSVVGFGHLPLGGSSATTLTLPFTTGQVGLGAVKVFTFGTQNLDFTSGPDTTCNSSTPASTFCSVEISFLPTAAGIRKGAVVLLDASQNPILTIPLYGFSDAPLAALSPSVASVISTGGLPTSNPFQLALDGAGNIYVGDYTGKNVTKIPAGGGSASLVSLGTPGSIAVQNITGVAVDGAGNLFIGDHQNSRILAMTPGGVVSVLTINGLSPALGFPTALTFDGAGNLFIADFTNGRVVEVSSLVVAGSTSSGKGTVIATGSLSFTGSTLTGLTIDAQGNLYIAARTQNSSHIIKVTASGAASPVAIPGNITPAISNPQGVSADAMGNLYIVDTANSRIVRITSAGVASVVGITGLTSPATLSTLVFGETTDNAGNLYIPDWTNNRIVFVNVSGSALSFASTGTGLTSSDSPKTATLTNLGDQALVVSTNPGYTANFSQPTGATSQCLLNTSLAAGTACNVSVQFTPLTAGSLSAGITVTDNTLNVAGSTQQISVSGVATSTGDATAVAVTSNPASAAIGQPLTITATVSDTATGHTTTVPTGSITFTDTVGSTAITLNGGTPVTLSGGVATLTGVTLNGVGAHTILATYAGVSGTFLSSSNTTTLTVGKDSETIAGPAEAVQIPVGQAGSVAITITGPYSGTAVPTGSVTYNLLDSTSTSVASGSVTLTAGETSSTASVAIAATLPAGAYTLSITYGGDGIYAASATATAIQVVIAAPDFGVGVATGSPTTATVSPGGLATYNLTFAPSDGISFQAPVTFTVTGLPTGATATITPRTLPAGSGTTNIKLDIQVPQQTASLFLSLPFHQRNSVALHSSMLMLGMVLLPFGGIFRRAVKRRIRNWQLPLLLVTAAMLLGLSGCGATNSGFFGTAPKSYVITVTATSGTLSHSTTLTLTVK